MLNYELHMEDPIVTLASSGVLVSVDVNVWSATKQDREISSEVTAAKRADPDAGRFVKRLLVGDNNHKAVSNYRQTIYNWVKRNTYPWSKTQDILPTLNLQRFMSEWQGHEAEFNRLLDVFINHYASIVSDMAFKQGDMFNPNDYPPADEVRRKFGVRLYVSEVPTQDWRCRVADDTAADLLTRYQGQAMEIITGIMDEQAARLSDILNNISRVCEVKESEGNPGDSRIGEGKSKRRRIHDSTFTKAEELCRVVRQFNLTNDARLDGAITALEAALTGVTPDGLRESDAMRAKVKDDVDDILSKFGF